jgi:hypothetical protein
VICRGAISVTKAVYMQLSTIENFNESGDIPTSDVFVLLGRNTCYRFRNCKNRRNDNRTNIR